MIEWIFIFLACLAGVCVMVIFFKLDDNAPNWREVQERQGRDRRARERRRDRELY